MTDVDPCIYYKECNIIYEELAEGEDIDRCQELR